MSSKELEEQVQPNGPIPSSFRLELEKILLNNKPLSKKLNAIEALHKRHRNKEIKHRLQHPPNKSSFSESLFGELK